MYSLKRYRSSWLPTWKPRQEPTSPYTQTPFSECHFKLPLKGTIVFGYANLPSQAPFFFEELYTAQRMQSFIVLMAATVLGTNIRGVNDREGSKMSNVQSFVLVPRTLPWYFRKYRFVSERDFRELRRKMAVRADAHAIPRSCQYHEHYFECCVARSVEFERVYSQKSLA